MRNLSFHEVMMSDHFTDDPKELERDLIHICQARSGSGPQAKDMLAEIAAQAIAELKRMGWKPPSGEPS